MAAYTQLCRELQEASVEAGEWLGRLEKAYCVSTAALRKAIEACFKHYGVKAAADGTYNPTDLTMALPPRCCSFILSCIQQ